MRTGFLPLLAAALMFPGSARAQIRDFEDTFGRTIKAELIAHTGADAELVKIKKSDGNEFEVKVSMFSKKDQAFIREWMKATPPTINYAFRIEAAKQKFGAGTASGYDVEVTNLAREKVDGIVVKTRSLYEYYYVPYGSNYYGYAGKAVAYEEKFEVPGEMKFNQTAKFSTTNRYNLIGLMVRVYNAQGEVVEEEKIGSTKIATIKWEDGRQRKTSTFGSRPTPRRSTVVIED